LSALPQWARQRVSRYAFLDLPDERARWLPVAAVLRRIGRGTTPGVERAIDFLACRAFDWQVAEQLPRAAATGVVACEISALDTFREAKSRGMTTILDAASVHYAVQDAVTPMPESPWLHERIVRVKREEVALADHVLTVSGLARDGYIEAGVPEARVHAVVLGADSSMFTPDAGRRDDPSRPCTFLFAGATIHRKGIDLLLDAFRRVQAQRPGRARLVVVGPRGDAHPLLDNAGISGIEVVPAVAQPGLLALYRDADCFVLPSRHDSFGMVVVEAMACGIPAIVSGMVGAREAIEEGRNGWVVPLGDAVALAERMAWCVDNRAALAGMRVAARAAAERYSWDAYGTRLVAVMKAVLGGSA
jgi:glycosyltransferase involved in cell wall biosynthesis